MEISNIVDEILISEGWPKYTNDPEDEGGPTKGGITLATYSRYIGRDATPEELQAMPEVVARKIYEERYILAPGFHLIEDPLLRWHVVDCGVLHGQGTATRWLQSELGVAADGKLGAKTLAALRLVDPHTISLLLFVQRQRWIARRMKQRPDQLKWIEGWTNRATAFVEREAQRKEQGA